MCAQQPTTKVQSASPAVGHKVTALRQRLVNSRQGRRRHAKCATAIHVACPDGRGGGSRLLAVRAAHASSFGRQGRRLAPADEQDAGRQPDARGHGRRDAGAVAAQRPEAPEHVHANGRHPSARRSDVRRQGGRARRHRLVRRRAPDAGVASGQGLGARTDAGHPRRSPRFPLERVRGPGAGGRPALQLAVPGAGDRGHQGRLGGRPADRRETLRSSVLHPGRRGLGALGEPGRAQAALPDPDHLQGRRRASRSAG